MVCVGLIVRTHKTIDSKSSNPDAGTIRPKGVSGRRRVGWCGHPNLNPWFLVYEILTAHQTVSAKIGVTARHESEEKHDLAPQ